MVFRVVVFYISDIDECTICSDLCHSNSHCVNEAGSYHCACDDGYNATDSCDTVPVCEGSSFGHLQFI